MRMGLPRTSHTPHAHPHPTPVLGGVLYLLGTAEAAAPAPDGDTVRLQVRSVTTTDPYSRTRGWCREPLRLSSPRHVTASLE
eukprot:960583-Prymnesium_polylepis.1